MCGGGGGGCFTGVFFIVVGFNDVSTLVGHFVSSPRKKGRKEIEEIVEEMKERDLEERGTGMKVKIRMKVKNQKK